MNLPLLSVLCISSFFLKPESQSGLVPDIFVTGICGCSITVIILKVPSGSCAKYKLVKVNINTTYKTQYAFIIFKLLLLSAGETSACKYIFLFHKERIIRSCQNGYKCTWFKR